MPAGIPMTTTNTAGGAASGAAAGSMAGPWGAVGGALIGGGLGLAGSLVGGSNKKQIRWQREQLQKGIQYRVADAKKAGIHPLYALGANIQSPSPIQVSGGLGEGLQQMGQGLGQISQRFQMNWERQQTMAQIRVMESETQKNIAMSQFYRSQALNPQSSSAPQASLTTDSAGNIIGPGEPQLPGQVNLKPMDMYSTAPGNAAIGAGKNPATMKFMLHRNLPFNGLFSTEGFGESKENTPLHETPGLILQNALQYGDKAGAYIKDYIDFVYLGRPPSRDWNRVPKPDGYMYQPSFYDEKIKPYVQEQEQKVRKGWDKLKKSWQNRVK